MQQTEKMESFLLVFITLTKLVSAVVLILPDEGIENCPEFADIDAGYFGIENLEIIVESDTEVFLNGSVIIMKELRAPWNVEYYAEELRQNKWTRSPIQKKFNDFCGSFHNPTDIWYMLLKDFPGCDFKAGVRTKLF